MIYVGITQSLKTFNKISRLGKFEDGC